MAGFNRQKAYEDLNIPAEVSVIAMMAVGYPGDVSQLAPKLLETQNAKRERKPIDELVFKGRWPGVKF